MLKVRARTLEHARRDPSTIGARSAVTPMIAAHEPVRGRHLDLLRTVLAACALLGPLVFQGKADAALPDAAQRRFSQFHAQHWMPEQGLPSDSGYSLDIAGDGQLWIGTTEGLARFDGRRFEVFDRRTDATLPSNEVWWVDAHDDGSLTVALASGALLHGVPGRFERWPLAGTDPVRLFHRMPDGRAWICRSTGIELHDRRGVVSWRLPVEGLGACVLTADGHLVAHAGHEGIRVSLSGESTHPVRIPIPGASGASELGLHAERGTTWLWNATSLVEWPDGRTPTQLATPEGLRGCINFLRTPDGTLWCAANRRSGLSRSLAGPLQMQRVEGSPDGAFDLAADRDGGLWVMTWGQGLWRISAPPVLTIGATEGLEPARLAFLHERPDGTLLLGGRGRIWSWHNDRLQPLALPPVRSVSESWLAVTTSASGEILLGRHHGLSTSPWPPAAGAWRDVYAGADDGVYALTVSSDSAVWIGSEFVARWAGDAQPIMVQSRLPLVYAFVEDVDGRMWAATQDGIWRQSADGSFVRTDARGPDGRRFIVMSATRDDAGRLWFGGYETGLWRHDGRGWSHYTSDDGLPSDTAYGLVDDGHGRLWISHGRGLYTLGLGDDDAPLRARIREYGRADGLRGAAFNGGSGTPALRTRDGLLWFSSDDGAVRIDPARMPVLPKAPPIRIDAIIADDGLVRAPASTLELDAGAALTRVRVESPAPGVADHVDFVWRLVPLAEDWQRVPVSGEIELTRLPPGLHRLELANRIEGQLHPGAAIEIRQRAPWYLHPATWAAAVFAFVAAAMMVFRWRLWALNERNRRLEATVAERTAALLAEQRRVLDAEAARREAEQALQFRLLAESREIWNGLDGDARLVLAAVIQNAGASRARIAEIWAGLVASPDGAASARFGLAWSQLERAGLVRADGPGWCVGRPELAMLPDVRQPLADLALAQSRRVGAYRLLECIGSGGHGEVFRAINVHDQSTAAIKLLYADAELRRDAQRRLEREGDVVSRIRHPNIVRMLERGEHDGRIYLAMSYVPGRTLANAIAEDGAFAPARVRRIAFALADALATLHEAGVVHRDVNPNNIRLQPNDEPVLLDFGLARGARHSTLTRPQTLLGTLPYMAPEQLRGEEATAAADAWALGIVCVEMLTGSLPWRGVSTIEMAVEVGGYRSWADYPAITPAAWDLRVRSLLVADPALRPGIRDWMQEFAGLPA